MNTKENRRKWTAALRSGEFDQTQEQLRDRDTFCCLGVACELYRRETGKGEWTDEDFFDVYKVELPKRVSDWFGLVSGLGNYNGTSLANLNDTFATFEEIADMIDAEPEGLIA